MGKAEARQKYIHTQAAQALAHLDISVARYATINQKKSIASMLWRDDLTNADILSLMRDAKEDYLARIASCGLPKDDQSGNVRLCEVRADSPNWHKGGKDTLVQLAAMALTAALADLIWARLHAEPLLKCRFCNWSIAKQYKSEGRLESGFKALTLHVSDEHPDQYDKIQHHADPLACEEA